MTMAKNFTGTLYYGPNGELTETYRQDGRKFREALISDAYAHGVEKGHASFEMYVRGELFKGRTDYDK